MEHTNIKRWQLLARSHLLDSPTEEAFNRFTQLIAMLLDVPISLVTLVDKDRQYFKSYCGLPEPWASRQQTPFSHSFCQYVVAFRGPLIVHDARENPLLEHNLAIPELGVIAYLGFPLVVEDQALGSLCAIDTRPRVWSEREIKIVQEMAHFVATEIALRIEMSERQELTEQLQESEERFRTLANEAPIIIWQADASGSATFFNAAWLTFTGLSVQESLGDGWLATVHPDDQAAIQKWRQGFALAGSSRVEFRVRCADGVYRDMIGDGAAYTGQRGTPLGYIGTLVDITEQKELVRQREAFISIAAHELKTPLTAVHCSIQLVQWHLKKLLSDVNKQSSQEQQRICSQIAILLTRSLENLQVQTTLIHDLEEFSRFREVVPELHLAPCDLVELVKHIVQDQQTTSPQRQLLFESPEEISALVQADAQRIRQVLNNYLVNASKYSSLEQPVHVGVTIEGDSALVWVRDHGKGLSAEQQEHVWERFYQTREVSVSTGSPGLGLGLHICQALIQGHHGAVGVKSVKGQGSTFWFTLPLLRVESQE